MKKNKKTLIIFIFTAISFITIFFIILGGTKYFLNTKILQDKIVYVKKGESLNSFIRKLKNDGIIKDELLFKIIIKFKTLNRNNIKYGEYFFEKNSTVKDIMNKILNNKVYYRTITFAEGLSTHSILKIIQQNEFLVGEVLEYVPEGSLLPETYTYQRGETRKSLIYRMQKHMETAIDKLWEERDKELPFKTKQEAIILASIVEEETGVDEERKLVASVFINRMRIRMPLQSDPTAVYGYTFGDVSKEKEIKTNILIKKDSPYNTYKTRGLPITPICNPGRASIEAVLRPAKTKYLFFVATGNGGHNFSENYAEHIKFVSKFRKAVHKKQ